jgi:hypothetical protein
MQTKLAGSKEFFGVLLESGNRRFPGRKDPLKNPGRYRGEC